MSEQKSGLFGKRKSLVGGAIALAAVVVPEVLVSHGAFITTWQDARLFAAVAGAGCYFWRRDVLVTILGGMAVYLPLHLGLGW